MKTMPSSQQTRDYERIAKAIRFIEDHHRDQPGLDDIATAVHLSPYHFQRLFSRWAGISPTRFMQSLTLAQCRAALDRSDSVLDTALDAGLSGPSRLHDLFVTFEAVTPGEYKQNGAGLTLRYGYHDGPFGRFLVVSSDRGLCGLEFTEDGPGDALTLQKKRWAGATFVEDPAASAAIAARIFTPDPGAAPAKLNLFVRGTNFQVKVWEALLRVPPGALTTYRALGSHLGMNGAARAVGNAVGANPICYLIPCHRVIRSTGVINHYRWGRTRKMALLGWEAARDEAA